MIKLIKIYFLKAAIYKNSSLVSLSILSSTFTGYLLDLILGDKKFEDLSIPIMVSIGGFLFFLLFSTIDFITGIQASYTKAKKRAKANGGKTGTVIKSYKLWHTFWKTVGVGLVFFIILFFMTISKREDLSFIYSSLLIASLFITFFVCGYEYQSIGENIEKTTGYKPKFFSLFDKLLDVMQLKFLSWAKEGSLCTRKVEEIEEGLEIQESNFEQENIENE